MNKALTFLTAAFLLLEVTGACAQDKEKKESTYWNTDLKITPWRLPPPPIGYKPVLKDLDGDGDPDIMYSVTRKKIQILWVDDDDDMKWTDFEGDTDSDCLLIDKNSDGRFGGMGDLIVDWVDNDGDGKADMQVLVDYPLKRTEEAWPNGHYMVVLDTDKDNIFNYIDWNSFEIKAWDKNGISDFLLDYSGKSAFLKIHVATYTMDNLKLNWENPFLFYDPDHDGLSEMAIRFVDTPKKTKFKEGEKESTYNVKPTGKIDWVSIAVDMDNDNAPGNEFDYDFSINFKGTGFDYMDQVHPFPALRGLVQADTFFMDPRWRQMNELIYPDHDHALDLIFNRGKWDRTYFIYDEDDDCNRWERVEFYDPLDPFIVGSGKGGIDNNVQTDAAGDRGEWDMDNSGKGNLYVGRFDGRLHLFGSEWGIWRIDQTATFYQGWDRKWLAKDPSKFATVKYEDSDLNGFIDRVYYDLDGDKIFEDSVSLTKLGLSDVSKKIDISRFAYRDYLHLQEKMASDLWKNGQHAKAAAKKFGLDTGWYAKLAQASSIREKYNNGYWLQLYIFMDLRDLFRRKGDLKMEDKLIKAYYGGNWQEI